jgi:DNA integrity scanning protein DisA with diadenylate cyclase activity/mannitol/fructose-specific phosphotransferase system IIA component (Ntr-type)
LELGELVSAIRIYELSAKTRPTAIRYLVGVANWEDEGIPSEEVLKAVEEREAAAQTLVAPDFALPHAFIDWDGDFRIVLGRSRIGIDYGVPTGNQVKLICLLVLGRKLHESHVEVLAALAELLKSGEFRQQLIDAKDIRNIEELLAAKAGIQPGARPARAPGIPKITQTMVRQGIDLVKEIGAQALLLTVDRVDLIPWEPLKAWKGRLLLVANEHPEEIPHGREDTHVFDVPHQSLSRMDRANLGLLLAASSNLLTEKNYVVCVTGADGRRLDSLSLSRPESHFRAMFSEKNRRGRAVVRPAVILRALSLAIEIAAEGRESHPLGTMFVLGDTRNVLRHAKQLVLNPFHGYARSLRSLLDPSLSETVKEFALLDGAFIVEGDGTVFSAGTYLLPKAPPHGLPSGLGTRHQTAAAITAHTLAMAITVSQSTGTVTVFRNGNIVFSLERAGRTRW